MRVAVLSDIHANLVALDAVLAAIGTVDAIWHLGDVVGYGPEPDAVVERLDGVGAIGVRGNHDLAAIGGARDRAVQRRRAHRDGVDPRPDRRRRPATGWRPCRSGRSRTTFTPRPRQPARPDLGVHPRRRDRAGEPRGPRDAATACSATPICRRLSARRDAGHDRRRSPADGDRARPSTAGGPCSTPAASASRATATRAPAGSILDTDAARRSRWRPGSTYDIAADPGGDARGGPAAAALRSIGAGSGS